MSAAKEPSGAAAAPAQDGLLEQLSKQLGVEVSYATSIKAYAVTSVTLYMITSALLHALVTSDPAALAIARTINPDTYKWPAVGFFTAVLFECLGWYFSSNNERQKLVPVPMSTMLIAGVACWSFTHEGSPVLLTGLSGRMFRPGRWLEWSFTTPSLIFVIGQTCAISNREVLRFMAQDCAMILGGWLATYSRSMPLVALAFAVSVGNFACVMKGIWEMFELSIKECHDRDGAQDEIRKLRLWTMCIWPLFPAIWCAAAAGLVAPQTEEVLWHAFQILAKLLLEAALFQGTMCSIDERKMVSLTLLGDVYHKERFSELVEEAKRKERFFAAVSHELRTPLNGIIGLAEAMLAQHDRQLKKPAAGKPLDVSDKAAKTIRTIRDSGSRLASLVNNILDSAAMKEKQLTVKREKVNLRHVIEEVVQLTRPLLKRGVEIAVHTSGRAHNVPSIVADATRVVQIMHNVLGNAVKFTTEGSITVATRNIAADDSVGLGGRGGDGTDMEGAALAGVPRVAISVTDTGTGIPPQSLKKIFDAFEQVDMSTTRKHGGTGLGLSLARQLMQAHHGSITVDSEMGKGSTFTCYFPVRQPRDAPADGGDGSSSIMGSQLGDGDYGGRSIAGDDERWDEMSNADAMSVRSFDSPSMGGTRSLSELDEQIAALTAARNTMAGGGHVDKSIWTKIGEALTPSSMGSTRQLSKSSRRGGSGNDSRTSFHTPGSRPPAPGMLQLAGDATSGGSAPLNMHPTYSSLKAAGKLPEPPPGGAAGAGGDDDDDDEFADAHYEILSVDDDPTNQMVVENLLQGDGRFKVIKAMDAFEAFEVLESRPYLPDLILLDVMMPKMNGYEACEEIRRRYPDAPLPIIMVSARSQEDNVVAGLQAGCNDYVSKPFRLGEIVARIETQIRLANLRIVELEAARTGRLLNAMLPANIIERLKGGTKLIADSHRNISILFTDIVGFTKIAATLPTAEVILLLNEMFTLFDGLVDRYGVHKVETIGDAYMAVAGHEAGSRDDHAQRVLAMAKAMVNATAQLRLPQPVQREDGGFGGTLADASSVPIRCGVHTGAAYAGVVGAKCPRYCFFGKTVNVAMALQSHGFGGLVQVSSETRDAAVVGGHSQQSGGESFSADDFLPLPPRSIDGIGEGEVTTYVLREDTRGGGAATRTLECWVEQQQQQQQQQQQLAHVEHSRQGNISDDSDSASQHEAATAAPSAAASGIMALAGGGKRFANQQLAVAVPPAVPPAVQAAADEAEIAKRVAEAVGAASAAHVAQAAQAAQAAAVRIDHMQATASAAAAQAAANGSEVMRELGAVKAAVQDLAIQGAAAAGASAMLPPPAAQLPEDNAAAAQQLVAVVPQPAPQLDAGEVTASICAALRHAVAEEQAGANAQLSAAVSEALRTQLGGLLTELGTEMTGTLSTCLSGSLLAAGSAGLADVLARKVHDPLARQLSTDLSAVVARSIQAEMPAIETALAAFQPQDGSGAEVGGAATPQHHYHRRQQQQQQQQQQQHPTFSSPFSMMRANSPPSSANFLQQAGLGHYASILEGAEVDIQLLPCLDDAELKELGMTVGARRRLRQACAIAARNAD